MSTQGLSKNVSELIDTEVASLRKFNGEDSRFESAVKESIQKISTVLVSPSSRQLEEAATRFVASDRELASKLFVIGTNQNLSEEIKSFILLACAIGFRRLMRARESLESIELLKKCNPNWQFLDPLCKHLESLNYLQNPSKLGYGLELSSQAAKELPDNAGIRHAHGQFLLENAIWNSTDSVDENESRVLLENALREVNAAIALQENWPKFHQTKGRILLRLSGERRTEGLREIERAIATEKIDTMDNQQRIITYQLELALEELRTEARAAQNQIKDFESKLKFEYEEILRETMREQQGQTVVVLAFLTSVIALVQFGAGVFEIGRNSKNGTSLMSAVLSMGAMGVILFGATFLGAFLLRRKRKSKLND